MQLSKNTEYIRLTKNIPDKSFVGKIFGHNCHSPLKEIECFIITRVTKVKVFARRLELFELKKPDGNGFFVQENLGLVCIDKPLKMCGEQLAFTSFTLAKNGSIVDYIQRKGKILFLIDENIKWHTLSPGSSVWSKV